VEQLLTAEEVASILKVSPSAVFKWAKRKVIPSYRIHEKCLRFKREDIVALIEKGKGVELTYKKDGHP
jgi:excisionase family DNA binding protein